MAGGRCLRKTKAFTQVAERWAWKVWQAKSQILEEPKTSWRKEYEKKCDFHFVFSFFWILRSTKHVKFWCEDHCVKQIVPYIPFNTCWELVHLNGVFHMFNGTEMLEDHRLFSFYRNSNFYYLSRWKIWFLCCFRTR